jgi:mannose-6-phosphate isomerase-like protein (cupin superfamily)
MAKHIDLHREKRGKFHLLLTAPQSQAAIMDLLPDESTDGSDNIHRSAEQWLYVMAGKGVAVVAGETFVLSEGILLYISPNEVHKISASDGDSLRLLSIYAPPVFEEEMSKE